MSLSRLRRPLGLLCLLPLLAAAAPLSPPPATRPTTRPDYSRYQERWVTPPKKAQPLVRHLTYRSDRMGVDVGYCLYLPPGYASTDNAARRYPVVYWLHGLNQSESADQFTASVVDAAIRAGTLPPLIVVYATGGGRAFYTDSPDGKILGQTTIITELIPHVDKTYRTVAARGGRAIQGMSMGGWGALKLSMTHPDLFSSVVAFAPSLRTPENIRETYPDIITRMYAGDPERFRAVHPLTLARANADTLRAKLPISVFVGDKDHLLAGSRDLHALLGDLKIPHDYEEIPGVEHNLTKLIAQVKARGLAFAARHFAQP